MCEKNVALVLTGFKITLFLFVYCLLDELFVWKSYISSA